MAMQGTATRSSSKLMHNMSASMQDHEQQELIQGFLEESREMLDAVEPQLIELEKGSDYLGGVDFEVVNAIFRLFHSLKGGAGFLGFETVQKVTHQAETLLDLFRKGAATLSSVHVDLLMRTCDFIRRLMDNIEIQFTDKGLDEDGDLLVAELQKATERVKNEPAVEVEGTAKAAGEPAAIEERDADNRQFSITEEMVKQFTTEGEELLETAEEALLNLEKEPEREETISQAFRSLHSFKGNAGFFGYSDLETLSHQMETALDMIRAREISADADLISLLLEVLDSLREGLRLLNRGEDPNIPGVTGWVNLLTESVAHLGGTARLDETCNPENLLTDDPQIFEQPTDTEQTGQSEDSSDGPRPGDGLRGEALAPQEVAPCQARSKATAPFPERRLGEDRRQIQDRRAGSRQTVRVDVEKLDSLLDLVGELVIAEAMVAQSPDLKGLNVSLDRFEKSVRQLEKISRDLQDRATSIRMIPLSGTFRRMIRLVRDLSQKAGKKVELELIGEETEVDKTVIEQINDPLVHIIRNSIDHGIETPQERRQSGKNHVGKVTLEAKYVGGEVWITVHDDGRGLSREKILSKAIERGILSGEGSDLRDEDIWQLVFQPGFSTAEKVTDISGRGVGMDVVKRNIENIRGKVEVYSEAGRGSSIILRIPLTLAIIDGMMVRVGKTRYMIPLIAVKESLQPAGKDITRTMDGQEIVNIRGKLLPVVRLHELLNVRADCATLTEGIILIVENQGRSICLFVDEQLGQQQIVIKGLSNYFGAIQCVSGCTILGDGEISLIIDVAGVIAKAGNSALPNWQYSNPETDVPVSENLAIVNA